MPSPKNLAQGAGDWFFRLLGQGTGLMPEIREAQPGEREALIFLAELRIRSGFRPILAACCLPPIMIDSRVHNSW